MTASAVSLVEQAVQSYRAELLRLDARALQAVSDLYAPVREVLVERVALLEAQLAEAGAVSVADALRLDRARELLAQTEAELARLAPRVEGVVLRYRQAALTLAGQHAEGLAVISALQGGPALAANVEASWTRLNTGAAEQLIGRLSGGSPLRKLLGKIGGTAASKMEAKLKEQVALGTNPRGVAAALANELDVPHARLLLISRTEALNAYRGAQTAVYAANDDILGGYIWTCSKGPRTCLACLSMDGTHFPLDSSFSKMHPACLPAGVVVSGPPVEASFQRWYEGDLIFIRLAGGDLLPVTPNHPVLTAKGWVVADALREGDEVIRCLDSQRVFAEVNPDHQNGPALIQEVAVTLGSALPMSATRMPVSSEDFHGDGTGDEVCVVRANGLLSRAIDPTLMHPFAQQEFGGRDMGLVALLAGRALAHLLPGQTPAGVSLMSRARPLLAHLGGGVRHTCDHAFGSPARGHSGADEVAANGGAYNAKGGGQRLLGLPRLVSVDDFARGKPVERIVAGADFHTSAHQHVADLGASDMVLAGDLLHRLAGLVTADHVVRIDRARGWSGHVFNLQTSDGWYIANNIITHNCRCAYRPSIKGIDNHELPTGRDWFYSQPVKDQLRMLPPSAREEFRRGDLDLADFVKVDHSEKWGDSHRVGGVGWARRQAARRDRRAA